MQKVVTVDQRGGAAREVETVARSNILLRFPSKQKSINFELPLRKWKAKLY